MCIAGLFKSQINIIDVNKIIKKNFSCFYTVNNKLILFNKIYVSISAE